jgi:hypothetical protein
MENIRQSIEDFLSSLSSMPTKTHCPQCYSTLLTKTATFFFYDGEESWAVPISICPNCESKREDAARGSAA